MKCIVEDNHESCRRCQSSGLPCVFVARANAASLPEHILTHVGTDENFKEDVLCRIKVIEEYLGLPSTSSAGAPSEIAARMEDGGEQMVPEHSGLSALSGAASALEKSAPRPAPPLIWSRSTIEQLWSWLVLTYR